MHLLDRLLAGATPPPGPKPTGNFGPDDYERLRRCDHSPLMGLADRNRRFTRVGSPHHPDRLRRIPDVSAPTASKQNQQIAKIPCTDTTTIGYHALDAQAALNLVNTGASHKPGSSSIP